MSQPARVAVVGSGPSGFYAAEALLKGDAPVEIHMFERLPVPFGLVRFGVAPDHANIRKVAKVYARTAAHEGFHFWGNVEVGRHITVPELRQRFDAVVLAYGAATDRQLGIPGEELDRSYTATAFCAWYNGHPDFADTDFALDQEVAVVVGQGNVAMDVCRILATPAEQFVGTDMAGHAIEALRNSRVREIHCLGRRGPVQAAFTPKELGELGHIEGCDIVIDPASLELDAASARELEDDSHGQRGKNFAKLQEFAARERSGAPRSIHVHFHVSPLELLGDGAVEAVRCGRNRLEGEPGRLKAVPTGESFELPAQLLFRSIGYRGTPLPDTPFREDWGVVPNEEGRVEPGLYAAGWIKRGPSGLIGTNKKDSEETVGRLLEDLPHLPRASRRDDRELRELLAQRGCRPVSFAEALAIEAAELARGEAAGRPRENFTKVAEMLAILGGDAS